MSSLQNAEFNLQRKSEDLLDGSATILFGVIKFGDFEVEMNISTFFFKVSAIGSSNFAPIDYACEMTT